MKTLMQFVLLVFLLATVSASAQDIRYNFDRETDFAKFKSYKWVSLAGTERLSDLVDKQIKAALDAELARKGLTKTEKDDADLYIGYQASVGQEKQFTSYGTDWGYGPGWYRGGWYGPGISMTTGETSTIYIGQLALDMYDSANRTLVWRGLASKTLDPKAKPEKRQKNLDKAAVKLLRNYPPISKK